MKKRTVSYVGNYLFTKIRIFYIITATYESFNFSINNIMCREEYAKNEKLRKSNCQRNVQKKNQLNFYCI